MLDVFFTHSILIQLNILCLTFVRISLKSLGCKSGLQGASPEKLKKEKLRINAINVEPENNFIIRIKLRISLILYPQVICPVIPYP